MQKQVSKLEPAERAAVEYLNQVVEADEIIALGDSDLAPHVDAIKAVHVNIHAALSSDTEKGILAAVGKLDAREKQVLTENIDILTKGDPVDFLDRAAEGKAALSGTSRGFSVQRAGDVMHHPILAKIMTAYAQK